MFGQHSVKIEYDHRVLVQIGAHNAVYTPITRYIRPYPYRPYRSIRVGGVVSCPFHSAKGPSVHPCFFALRLRHSTPRTRTRSMDKIYLVELCFFFIPVKSSGARPCDFYSARYIRQYCSIYARYTPIPRYIRPAHTAVYTPIPRYIHPYRLRYIRPYRGIYAQRWWMKLDEIG